MLHIRWMPHESSTGTDVQKTDMKGAQAANQQVIILILLQYGGDSSEDLGKSSNLDGN